MFRPAEWLARTTNTSPHSLLGRVLRAPLTLVPSQSILPVVVGPLRGARWMVAAGNRSCWLGVYEWEKQNTFARLVSVGDVVFDVGANAGFYTVLASRLASRKGRVISFEPDPTNLTALRRHVEINGLQNVTIVPAAVSDSSGHGKFRRDKHQGRLDPKGDIEVQIVHLDALWMGSTVPRPALIKVDVEGEELAVIRGARRVLAECRPVVLVAAHSAKLRDECRQELQTSGYEVQSLDDRSELCELIALPAEAPALGDLRIKARMATRT